MNTTREQRAYGYISDNFDFSMMASVAAALSRVDLKAAYIAGATEEAAIKDKVILSAVGIMKNCAGDIGAKWLRDNGELLKELAKGKV